MKVNKVLSTSIYLSNALPELSITMILDKNTSFVIFFLLVVSCLIKKCGSVPSLHENNHD